MVCLLKCFVLSGCPEVTINIYTIKCLYKRVIFIKEFHHCEFGSRTSFNLFCSIVGKTVINHCIVTRPDTDGRHKNLEQILYIPSKVSGVLGNGSSPLALPGCVMVSEFVLYWLWSWDLVWWFHCHSTQYLQYYPILDTRQGKFNNKMENLKNTAFCDGDSPRVAGGLQSRCSGCWQTRQKTWN